MRSSASGSRAMQPAPAVPAAPAADQLGARGSLSQLGGHRFPVPMYAPIMVVIAAQMGTRSTFPSLMILIVIAILAAGYFGGREYVDRRSNRRSWK
jgi:hypothetical protein